MSKIHAQLPHYPPILELAEVYEAGRRPGVKQAFTS